MCSYNPLNTTQYCELKELKDVRWKENSYLRTKLVNHKIAHTETKMLTLESKSGEDLVSRICIIYIHIYGIYNLEEKNVLLKKNLVQYSCNNITTTLIHISRLFLQN